jgi:IS4 transposase
MVTGEVFERFLAASPVCVMERALLEYVFAPAKLEAVFHSAAVRQYERELLFSQVVDLTSLVVCRVKPSICAAYKQKRNEIPVSLRALYDKLQHIEDTTSRALVRHTGAAAGGLIDTMGGALPPLLPGYRVRILDGNHLSGTEHRLKVLRGTAAGALPGHSLVLLDPQRMVIEDVIVCEDGHAQERSLLKQVLPLLQPRDLLIDDRNFCTAAFLVGVAQRQARFITRQHGRMPLRLLGKRRYRGRSSTGRIYEQTAVVTDPATGKERRVRRISVRLHSPTRDGDRELHLLTNLPAKVQAAKVAELYRKRWKLETAFQELTTHLRCELLSLGYPPAALFGFCVAVSAYNLLAAIKGALRAAHGQKKIEDTLSNFYLTEEISSVYRGMMIAVPPSEWAAFQSMSQAQLAQQLLTWARAVDLDGYCKQPRGPKKPRAKRPNAKFRHVATAKLLPKKRSITRTRQSVATATETDS